MLNRYLVRTTLLLVVFIQQTAFGQSGSWHPIGADLRHPRVLLQPEQAEAVRASLATLPILELYQGVYGNAVAGPPTANEVSNDRRVRAQIAKNAAFVRYLDRKPLPDNAFAPLTSIEQTQLTQKAIGLLENLNPNVDAPERYTEWQWRSKELLDYLVAYDLLRGAGVPVAELQASRTKLQTFAGNLYSRAATPYLFGFVFFNAIKNNHALMTAAALGTAGVVLNDLESTVAAQQPANWLNAGLFHLDNVLWRDALRQSEPGVLAGYYEGPYYFKYAFLNCLPFIRAIGHFLPDTPISTTWGTTTRNVRNPAYDPNYDLLYDWASAITMPDGRLPALEDSFIDIGMPELALTGKPQYVHPLHLQQLAFAQLNTLSKQLDGTVDMRAAYIAANVPPTEPVRPVLTALPRSGNLVFRSGTGAEATYLHLNGKNGLALANTGGHNQGDASSFLLYAHGQLLALDPGYLSSGRRTELGHAANHNLILVDGKGPLIGEAGNPRDAEAFVGNSLTSPGLAYGEVRTSYEGATITRKTLFVRNRYFVLADFVTAPQPHRYTWLLHGHGLEGGSAAEGSFIENFAGASARWVKNGVTLQAHMTAPGHAASFEKAPAAHELTYNQTQNHTVLRVHQEQVANTQFLATLSPYQEGADHPVTTTLTHAGLAAAVTQTGSFRDLVFTQTGTAPHTLQPVGFANPVASDAAFTFCAVGPNQHLAQVFLQQGTQFQFGPGRLLQASERADVAWESLGQGEFAGAISRAAVLTLSVSGPPQQVQGEGISGWDYLPAQQQLRITFRGASSFRYQDQPTLLSAPKQQNAGQALQVGPVPVRELLQIQANQPDQQVHLRLYNLEGKQIREQHFRGQLQLPVSGLAPGVYLLHLHPKGGLPEVRKVVVAR